MCSIHAYHACHILHRLDLMCCHVCNMFGNVLPLNYWRNYVLGVKKKKKSKELSLIKYENAYYKYALTSGNNHKI